MIGRTVESVPGRPWVALALLALGAGLGAGGLATGSAPMALLAVPPIFVGLALWWVGRERPFAATFTEEGVEVGTAGGPSAIPYDRFRNVFATAKPLDPERFRGRRTPVHLVHEGGVVRFPARLNVPSHEVVKFLAGKVPAHGGAEAHAFLAPYVEQSVEEFGPDRVWVYRASDRRKKGWAYPRFRPVCLALLASAAVWIAYSAFGVSRQAENASGWMAAGFILAAFSGLFLLITFAGVASHYGVKNWKQSSLVVTPTGLAMVQGDMRGELRWPELLEIRFEPQRRRFHVSYATAAQAQGGITLKVKGAEIVVADIYDRPLFVIYERIQAAYAGNA